MAVSINIRAVDNYSRQLNDTRRSINNINTSIANNRRAALAASAGTRNVLNASNRLLSAERRILTAKSQQITLERRLATEAERARQKIIRETERAERASRKFAGALRGVQGNLIAVASTSVIFGLTDLARSFVETGNEIEGAVNAFDALGESGQAVTKYLIDVARVSDGITFEGLNVAVQRFRAAGASIEEATGFATGFGKQLALLNVSVADQTNFMRQLTQAYAGNNAEGDDLRTLFEVMPQLSDLSTRALGYQVEGWKTLRPAIEAAGVSVREWVALTSEIAAGTGTIDTDRFVIQFERLTETFRDIQREVGQRLLPVLSQGARTTNNFLQSFAESPGRFAAFTAGTLAASAIVVKFATGIRLALFPLNALTVQMPLAAAATQGLSFSTAALTARLAAAATSIRAYAAALATMSISAGAAIPIIGAVTLGVGALAIAMRNARAEASEFDTIMSKIAGADFGQTGVRRTNLFEGNPIGEIRTEIANLRTGLENASNELAELESRFSGAARAHLGNEINPRIESLRASIKNYTRVLDEAHREISSRPITLTETETLQNQITSYQRSLEQNERTIRHIYGNIANTLKVGIDEVEKIIADTPRRLRDAVDSTVLKRIQTLREEQERIQKLIDAVNLEITTRPISQRDTSSVDVFNQIGIAALEAADRVERARSRIRNAQSVGEARAAAVELERAISRQSAIQESQARDQSETAEEFALKRTEIRLRTAREIENIESTLASRILSILSREKTERERIESEAARQQRARIQEAVRLRRLEVQAFEQAAQQGQRYANALRSLGSTASRQRFESLVREFQAQGDSLDEAIRKANQFRGVLDTLTGPTNRLSTEFRRMRDNLDFKNRQLELGTRQFAQYSTAIQLTANAVSELLKPLRELDERLERTQAAVEQREEEVFTAPQQGPNLDTLRQEAGEEGRQFVNRLLKRQERDLDASLKRQYQQYQQFYNRVADLGIDALTGRIGSVREFVSSLAEEFLRGIIRVEIAERVTNARRIALEAATAQQRLNIDNALTNAKIANIQRLQQAQQAANSQIGAGGGFPGTSAINQAAGLFNLNIPGLSQFTNLLSNINVGNLASGGAGALGVSNLLFPQEFRNLSTGIGETISEGFRGFTDFIGSLNIQFSDGVSRKVVARSTASRRGRIHAD